SVRGAAKGTRPAPASAMAGLPEEVIEESLGTKEALEKARALGRTAIHVLIVGETGTGKEVAARAFHEASRREGSFQDVNTAAVPATLWESKLFGHEKGAFTGADKAVRGLIDLAEGGTLFLDEIGEMPLEMQKKLLTFLRTKTYLPVGASHQEPRKAD